MLWGSSLRRWFVLLLWCRRSVCAPAGHAPESSGGTQIISSFFASSTVVAAFKPRDPMRYFSLIVVPERYGGGAWLVAKTGHWPAATKGVAMLLFRGCDADLKDQGKSCLEEPHWISTSESRPFDENIAHNAAVFLDRKDDLYVIGGRGNKRIVGRHFHGHEDAVALGAWLVGPVDPDNELGDWSANATLALPAWHPGCTERRPHFSPFCEFDGRFSVARLGDKTFAYGRANVVGEEAQLHTFGGRHVQVAELGQGGPLELVDFQGYEPTRERNIYFAAVNPNPVHDSLIALLPVVEYGRAYVGIALSIDGRQFSRILPVISTYVGSPGRAAVHPVDGFLTEKGAVHFYMHENVPGVVGDHGNKDSRLVRYTLTTADLLAYTTKALAELLRGGQGCAYPTTGNNCGFDMRTGTLYAPQPGWKSEEWPRESLVKRWREVQAQVTTKGECPRKPVRRLNTTTKDDSSVKLLLANIWRSWMAGVPIVLTQEPPGLFDYNFVLESALPAKCTEGGEARRYPFEPFVIDRWDVVQNGTTEVPRFWTAASPLGGDEDLGAGFLRRYGGFALASTVAGELLQRPKAERSCVAVLLSSDREVNASLRAFASNFSRGYGLEEVLIAEEDGIPVGVAERAAAEGREVLGLRASVAGGQRHHRQHHHPVNLKIIALAGCRAYVGPLNSTTGLLILETMGARLGYLPPFKSTDGAPWCGSTLLRKSTGGKKWCQLESTKKNHRAPPKNHEPMAVHQAPNRKQAGVLDS